MDTDMIGLMGELRVQHILNANKARYGIRFISNFPVLLDGVFCQIDILLLCSKGFFSLEVKQWQNCTVHCSDNRFWRIVYPSREIMVHSPVLQNRRHCNKVFGITGLTPENIVLFSEDAKIRNPTSGIMYIGEFIEYLAGLPDILCKKDIDNAYHALQSYKKSIEPRMLMDFIIKRAKI